MNEENPTDKTSDLLISLYTGHESDTAKAYDQISEGFDEFCSKISYLSPEKCLDLILNYCPVDLKEAKALDLGCGTGVMAELLKGKGVVSIVGLDASEGMLKKAEEKNLYEELHLGFLGTGNYPQKLIGQFDIVILAGVLNHFHAPPITFEEAASSLKPKGILVFSIPDAIAEPKGYMQKLKEMNSTLKFLDSVKFENYTVEDQSNFNKEFLKPVKMSVYAYQRID